MNPPKNKSASIWNRLKDENPEGLGDWLRWHPSQIDECIQARSEAMPAPLSDVEIAELKQAHAAWGADGASLASIDRLADPEARVIVTGQQPGLLAGPLLTAYKTIATIQLAKELAERHRDLRFVPVFWVASEDHDFQEVRRVFWPGNGGALEEILLEHPDWRPGRIMGTLSCAPMAGMLSHRIRGSTFETEFQKEVLEQLDAAYAPDRTWEEAFCRLMLRLFAHSGLVIVSPLMPWLRRRGAPIMRAEALAAGRSADCVIAQGEKLEKAGIGATLHRRRGAINFFWVDSRQRRHALGLEANGIKAWIPGEGETAESARKTLAASAQELAAQVEADPESFSLNVVTRPMAQDSILPTVAQVIGPGEASYLAQVEAVYDAFGVFRPVRYPRPEITLIPNSVTRSLKKYGLTLDQAMENGEQALTRMVIDSTASEGAVHDLRGLHDRHLGDLDRFVEVHPSDPSVRAAFGKLTQAMEKGYRLIEERLIYSRQNDHQHVVAAMAKIEHHLRPCGKPQERMLNPHTPFAINYGPDWLARLAPLIKIEPTAGPQTIYLADLDEGGSQTRSRGS